MSKKIQTKILHRGNNPFIDPRLKGIGSQKEREVVLESTEPSVIISTSGMLTGGPALSHLHRLAGNEKNLLLFVGYQAEGTTGRRIQKGWKQIQFENDKSMELKLQIDTVDGLSGHSDQREIIDFISRLKTKPKKILVDHGESSRALDLAKTLHRLLKVETMAPRNLETIRLK